jgi:hypothetical protein
LSHLITTNAIPQIKIIATTALLTNIQSSRRSHQISNNAASDGNAFITITG